MWESGIGGMLSAVEKAWVHSVWESGGGGILSALEKAWGYGRVSCRSPHTQRLKLIEVITRLP